MLLALLSMAAPVGALAQTAAPTTLVNAPRLAIDALSDPIRLAIFEASSRIESADLAADVRRAYAARSYAPLWSEPQAAPLRRAVMDALATAGRHGLAPSRYDAEGLADRLARLNNQRDRVQAEVTMMAAYLAYARDLSSGQLVPARVDSGIVREIARPDPAQLVQGLIDAPSPEAFLRGLIPTDPAYLTLLTARLRLEKALTDAGGDLPTVRAKSLAEGDSGPAVAALRDRLAALGYLPGARHAIYDAEVAAAVRAWQQDTGLSATGATNGATLEQINRPLTDRLRSITVSMERLRWMNDVRREGRYIWVNIPDFTARVYDDASITFETVTVVGEDVPEHRTPEFSDVMEHMVVNPSWNVPRSITVREYLPRMQANAGAAGHLEVIDSRGRVVPRDRINFRAYNEKTFPYRLRQPPADRNALGVVKFMFPNRWNIYLHDTPSKSLFSKTVRAFSHGCIRVGEPLGLADALLAPQTDDPRGLFKANLRGGLERSIPLKPPVPVHLVYFTAWPEAEGRITWRRDVYGRDRRVAAALGKLGVVFAGADD